MSNKYFVKTDAVGRIGATTSIKEYAEGMTEFEFPDDFDFNLQNDYRIVDGELIHDPLPVPVDEQIDELKNNLSATDYIPAKAMDALLRGADLSAIASEYSEVLDKRQEWRDKINELGGDVNPVVISILEN